MISITKYLRVQKIRYFKKVPTPVNKGSRVSYLSGDIDSWCEYNRFVFIDKTVVGRFYYAQ